MSFPYVPVAGSMLVSGGYDNTVALWDVDNMVQKLRLQVWLTAITYPLKPLHSDPYLSGAAYILIPTCPVLHTF